jgi:hypothetical protein
MSSLLERMSHGLIKKQASSSANWMLLPQLAEELIL